MISGFTSQPVQSRVETLYHRVLSVHEFGMEFVQAHATAVRLLIGWAGKDLLPFLAGRRELARRTKFDFSGRQNAIFQQELGNI